MRKELYENAREEIDNLILGIHCHFELVDIIIIVLVVVGVWTMLGAYIIMKNRKNHPC